MQWNNHGYDVAKIWGTKFDIISPVWLQVVRQPNGVYKINGEHDVDSGWIKDVRVAAHNKNKSEFVTQSRNCVIDLEKSISISFSHSQSFV